MAVKHYEVKGNTIVAKIALLTPKELKEIQNYRTLGYELVPFVEEPKTKEEKEAESKAKKYSKYHVDKFLALKENTEIKKEYDKVYNEQAGTNRKGKPDEPQFLKSGAPKRKGFISALVWLKENHEAEYTEWYDKSAK